MKVSPFADTNDIVALGMTEKVEKACFWAKNEAESM